jgi:hypothetical protein
LHAEPRALVVDLFGGLDLGALGPTTHRRYDEIVAALASVGFWIDLPTSVDECIAAIDATLTATERAKAAAARARYPHQYRTDERWLDELRRLYDSLLRMRSSR